MNTLPRARRNKLVIQELPGEVLVYDQERDKAHCLNQTAAQVWKQCDGKTDVATIAARLGEELHAPVDERVVWFALDQLSRDSLLEVPVASPAFMAGMTRRQMVRTLGLAAAIAVPLITSIMAPTTAHAVSCLANGQPCPGGPTTCCSNVCSSPGNICGS
jgi:Coenzyme PQQ synthesis protein D (PqqD)